MCTPLDLAKQRNHQAIVDYLQNQQQAQQANELPTNVLLNERAEIEENVKSGRFCRNSKASDLLSQAGTGNFTPGGSSGLTYRGIRA